MKCHRCDVKLADESVEFCEWCNEVVEFVETAVEAIRLRFGPEAFTLAFDWPTTTAYLHDNETGRDWRVEFRPDETMAD